MSLNLDTSDLPDAVDESLAANRRELVEFAETLVGYDTQNPPGSTTAVAEWVESTLSFGTRLRTHFSRTSTSDG